MQGGQQVVLAPHVVRDAGLHPARRPAQHEGGGGGRGSRRHVHAVREVAEPRGILAHRQRGAVGQQPRARGAQPRGQRGGVHPLPLARGDGAVGHARHRAGR
jgi:hypothetical protein